MLRSYLKVVQFYHQLRRWLQAVSKPSLWRQSQVEVSTQMHSGLDRPPSWYSPLGKLGGWLDPNIWADTPTCDVTVGKHIPCLRRTEAPAIYLPLIPAQMRASSAVARRHLAFVMAFTIHNDSHDQVLYNRVMILNSARLLHSVWLDSKYANK